MLSKSTLQLGIADAITTLKKWPKNELTKTVLHTRLPSNTGFHSQQNCSVQLTRLVRTRRLGFLTVTSLPNTILYLSLMCDNLALHDYFPKKGKTANNMRFMFLGPCGPSCGPDDDFEDRETIRKCLLSVWDAVKFSVHRMQRTQIQSNYQITRSWDVALLNPSNVLTWDPSNFVITKHRLPTQASKYCCNRRRLCDLIYLARKSYKTRSDIPVQRLFASTDTPSPDSIVLQKENRPPGTSLSEVHTLSFGTLHGNHSIIWWHYCIAIFVFLPQGFWVRA